jgi:hypothetical protein
MGASTAMLARWLATPASAVSLSVWTRGLSSGHTGDANARSNIAAFKLATRNLRPGQSGNPAGRPRGVRNKTTLAVEALLGDEAQTITRRAIELAKAGDRTALRLCLDRIEPPRDLEERLAASKERGEIVVGDTAVCVVWPHDAPAPAPRSDAGNPNKHLGDIRAIVTALANVRRPQAAL